MRRYDSGYRLLKDAIDSGTLGAPLMIHAAHRNPTVPDSYETPMAINDTLIHELDVLRWLLHEDYRSAQVLFPRKSRFAHEGLRDPQVILLETVNGVRIDVEVNVNCRYGYDSQCSIVGEEGIANLPEPQSLLVRHEAKLYSEIMMDWKDRFIAAFDTELQEFIDTVETDSLCGPSAWDSLAAAVASDACVQAQESGQVESIELPERPAAYG